MRLEQKKEVSDAYYDTAEKENPPKIKETKPKKAKSKVKKKGMKIDFFTAVKGTDKAAKTWC